MSVRSIEEKPDALVWSLSGRKEKRREKDDPWRTARSLGSL